MVEPTFYAYGPDTVLFALEFAVLFATIAALAARLIVLYWNGGVAVGIPQAMFWPALALVAIVSTIYAMSEVAYWVDGELQEVSCRAWQADISPPDTTPPPVPPVENEIPIILYLGAIAMAILSWVWMVALARMQFRLPLGQSRRRGLDRGVIFSEEFSRIRERNSARMARWTISLSALIVVVNVSFIVDTLLYYRAGMDYVEWYMGR